MSYKCVCSDCKSKTETSYDDKLALIQRVAAEKGVDISTKVLEKTTFEETMVMHAKARAAAREQKLAGVANNLKKWFK